MAQSSNDNFTKFAIERGGKVVPLLISLEGLGPSLTNPSILTVGDRVIVNLRNTNYISRMFTIDIFVFISLYIYGDR